MGVLPTIRPPGLVSGGGAAWSPDDEAALEIWLDASDVSSITETGGAVSQWNDKSGNDVHFSQATGSRQPATGSRAINSLNVIDFDGGDVIAKTSHIMPGSGDLSFLMIFVSDEVDTNTGQTFFRAGGVSRFSMQTTTSAGGSVYVDMFGTGNISAGFDVSLNEGQVALFRIVFDLTSGDWFLYQDGSLATDGTGGYATAFGDEEISIGGPASSAGVLDGAFGEFLLFTSVSDTVGQRAEGYLAHKWGLQASLPAGHPYKLSPP